MPVYKLIALLTILPLAYLLYKNPGPFLYIVPSPWRWLMVGGQLIAAIISAISAPKRRSKQPDSVPRLQPGIPGKRFEKNGAA
jgi:hypothetical protein